MVERTLEVAISLCIGIVQHTVTQRGLGPATTYRESLRDRAGRGPARSGPCGGAHAHVRVPQRPGARGPRTWIRPSWSSRSRAGWPTSSGSARRRRAGNCGGARGGGLAVYTQAPACAPTAGSGSSSRCSWRPSRPSTRRTSLYGHAFVTRAFERGTRATLRAIIPSWAAIPLPDYLAAADRLALVYSLLALALIALLIPGAYAQDAIGRAYDRLRPGVRRRAEAALGHGRPPLCGHVHRARVGRLERAPAVPELRRRVLLPAPGPALARRPRLVPRASRAAVLRLPARPRPRRPRVLGVPARLAGRDLRRGARRHPRVAGQPDPRRAHRPGVLRRRAPVVRAARGAGGHRRRCSSPRSSS